MTAIGLVVAFCGPPVVALLGPRLTNAVGTLVASMLGLLGIVAIVAFVLRVERANLTSLGVQPLHWSSIAWGLALAAFFVYAFTPAVLWALARLRLGGFERGLATMEPVPTWLLTLTILVVASAEEILYRGYAVERLAGMAGSYWIAGLVSVLAFAVAHLPNWGLGPALTTLVSGGILTAFYIWRQDLAANIVAHVVTDVVGLIVVPALARARPT